MRGALVLLSSLAALLSVALVCRPASACGGFFCSSSPVDQSTERIVFAVNPGGTTDMIVQIAYQGDSEDFAWLLPLANVPDPDKLDTFPELALTSLDTGTAPQFKLPANCQGGFFGGGGTAGAGGAMPTSVATNDAGVSVYIQQTVGPYDVAVIGSEDADATSQWLLDNEYRITSAMNEFVKLYTNEGMKFLALKLSDSADSSEVQPFRMRLPGDSPSIPLRLTSIAALPEMGILVWIFGDQRFEPAGEAKEVTIPDSDLRWDPQRFWGFGGPAGTNWTTLVARAADEAEGKAWVVEQAGSTTDLVDLVSAQALSTDDPRYEAQQALTQLINGRPYMTRLYTRLSPEEMTYDPVFKRSTKGDVARERELPFVAELCGQSFGNDTTSPCDFNPCGALGLCREVMDTNGQKVAACACAPGLTARAVADNSGFYAATTSVSCIDERLSFLNVGDKGPAGDVLPDPCVGVDCGENGQCVNMNMTPTCECKTGYVAGPKQAGTTALTCVMPQVSIPDSFYGLRSPERVLPMGREVHVVEVERPAAADGSSTSPAGSGGSSSCSTSPGRRTSGVGILAAVALFLLSFAAQRRRMRRAARQR